MLNFSDLKNSYSKIKQLLILHQDELCLCNSFRTFIFLFSNKLNSTELSVETGYPLCLI